MLRELNKMLQPTSTPLAAKVCCVCANATAMARCRSCRQASRACVAARDRPHDSDVEDRSAQLDAPCGHVMQMTRRGQTSTQTRGTKA